MYVTAHFSQDEYALEINIEGKGSVTKNPDQPTYKYNDVVKLTATPDPGWSFNCWTGDLYCGSNTKSITITRNMVVAAHFTQDEYTLSITTQGNGSVIKTPEQSTYQYSDVVNLTAVPNPGWSFAGWSGNISGNTNPMSVTITGNMNVIANFTQEQYTLSIATQGNGFVIKSPDQSSYQYNDKVLLTANPAPGWTFAGWSGDLTGADNPAIITITSNMNVTANFTQDKYTLNLTTKGNGTVTKDPDKPSYNLNEVVQLTANPVQGWTFAGWSGDLTGADNPLSITITSNMNVTANFTQDKYIITLTTQGTGSVTKDPDKSSYNFNDVVQLTANPAPGWSFAGWSGDILNDQNPLSIKMTCDMSITANFTQGEYTLTIRSQGNGSVIKNPDKSCYHLNEIVQLTAVPSSGWTFAGWSGDISVDTNPTSVTITGYMNVTANFSQEQYTLTITTQGNGSVTKVPDRPTYQYNDVVLLTAIPDSGWFFSNWSGDISGNHNPVSLRILGNMNIIAQFKQGEHQYTLTVAIQGNGSVTKNPDKSFYYLNEIVHLTAVPEPGWSFSNWSGDISSSNNPETIVITSNINVTANFTQSEYTLTITTLGNGSITKNPDKSLYNLNDVVQLTAIPDPGWLFTGWSGDVSNNANPVSIKITDNINITANFTPIEYTLIITSQGNGSVTKVPDQPTYQYNDAVVITAIPEPGWSFSSWSGDISGNNNPVNMTITSNMNIIAHFTSGEHEYTLTITMQGNGSVIKNPEKACYNLNEAVQLTAVPTPGWSFTGWSGDISGDVNPMSVTITGNMNVTANFAQEQYTLTITTQGNGSVIKAPDRSTYQYNDVVQLTAIPDSGWSFSGWSGDLIESNNSVSLTITGNASVNAYFTPNDYLLTINIDGSGHMEKNPDQPTYHCGDVVRLTAKPDSGWIFNNWSGDLRSSDNPIDLIINGNMNVTAHFIQKNEPGVPDIELVEWFYDFGEEEVGSSVFNTILIKNVGTTILKVTKTNILGSNNDQFSIISGGAPFDLEPIKVQEIVINFAPTSNDGKHAELKIISNDPDEGELYISLSGTGKEPMAQTKKSYAFPNPFNPEIEPIHIVYVQCLENVKIMVVDAAGNLVRELNDHHVEIVSQQKKITWDGRNSRGELVSNGIYFYSIQENKVDRFIGKIAVMSDIKRD